MPHTIEFDDDAYAALVYAARKLELGDLTEKVAGTVVRKLVAPYKRREPDPNVEKLVVADPLFGPGPSHDHRCWGADCPVCRQYFWEDIDTAPLPVSERPTKCDYCDQKLKLIYPWEIGEHV